MGEALRVESTIPQARPEGRAMMPAGLVMRRGASEDPALLDARWKVHSEEPYELLGELLGDGRRDSRQMTFAGSSVMVRTTRRPDGSLLFSVTSGSASLCRAQVVLDGNGGTLVVLTYRRAYGGRLLTVPEGVVLLEVLMGYALEAD